MGVGESLLWLGGNKCIRNHKLRNLQNRFLGRLGGYARHIGNALDRLLKHLPELDGFVVGRDEHVVVTRSPTPPDFVNLLFDFHTLEVVELGFMRLKLGIELVLTCSFLERHRKLTILAWTYHLVALKEDDAAALITGGQKVTRIVKLHRTDNIGYRCRMK